MRLFTPSHPPTLHPLAHANRRPRRSSSGSLSTSTRHSTPAEAAPGETAETRRLKGPDTRSPDGPASQKSKGTETPSPGETAIGHLQRSLLCRYLG